MCYVKLKHLRKNYGYTLDDMAKKLKISKTYYWQIENNNRKLSYEIAFKIASIFNTTPDDIFYEDFKIIKRF
jgi:putative transcriptional regulator